MLNLINLLKDVISYNKRITNNIDSTLASCFILHFQIALNF